MNNVYIFSYCKKIRKNFRKNYNKNQHNLIKNLGSIVASLAKIFDIIGNKCKLSESMEEVTNRVSPRSSTFKHFSPILDMTPRIYQKHGPSFRKNEIEIEDNFVITFDSDFLSDSISSSNDDKFVRRNEHAHSGQLEREITCGTEDQTQKITDCM